MEDLKTWLCWIAIYYLTSHAKITEPLRWFFFGPQKLRRGAIGGAQWFLRLMFSSARASGFWTGLLWPAEAWRFPASIGSWAICIKSGLIGLIVVSVGWRVLELLQMAYSARTAPPPTSGRPETTACFGCLEQRGERAPAGVRDVPCGACAEHQFDVVIRRAAPARAGMADPTEELFTVGCVGCNRLFKGDDFNGAVGKLVAHQESECPIVPPREAPPVEVRRWSDAYPSGIWCEICDVFACKHMPHRLFLLGKRLPDDISSARVNS